MAYTTVNKSSDYFNTKLWTGTGSENAITGIGFQPDWVWIKQRNTTRDHNAFDVVRGATKRLYPNANNAEETAAQVLKSFDSDGFTLGTDTSANQSSGTYAAWNWRAANSQGSSNTDGSINTTYTSTNTTSGFSISTYTGTGSNATVGHGLGAVPKVVLVKGIGHTSQWYMYHVGTGANGVMLLDNNAAKTTDTVSWQNTTPTSSVFSIGNDGGTNGSGNTYVAYCFSPIQGYSAMGSYIGNGNDGDGSFIYTGFKPAMIIIKCSDTAGEHWHIHDTKRQTGNLNTGRYLLANTTDAESTSTSYAVDIVSNGFKARTNNDSVNGSSKAYIYMAFAEAPLVGSNNVPATAR